MKNQLSFVYYLLRMTLYMRQSYMFILPAKNDFVHEAKLYVYTIESPEMGPGARHRRLVTK